MYTPLGVSTLQLNDEDGREIKLMPKEVVPGKAFFWLGIVTLAFFTFKT